MFKYMSLEPLPDITFGLFLLSWLVTRQMLYPFVVWAVIYDVPRLVPITWWSWITYSTLLTGLAILSLIWLIEIVRVAKSAVMGKPVEDTRSDEEE